MDATFRLLANYVNFMISSIYYAVSHNHNLEGIVGDDVITVFRQKSNLKNLPRYVNNLQASYLSS